MFQLIVTIVVGLATLACSQHFEDHKAQEPTFAKASGEDATTIKILKRSTDYDNTEWKDSGSDAEKRAWNNMQAAWGKRKWQDMQNPGWGKRSPTFPEFNKDIQANLQTSFTEDKRGWKDMQGASWGKRGWQDMRQPTWGKRGWKDMQSAAWGKRGWQDMQGLNWGKRGWQDMQGLNWGKRRWQDMPTAAWGKRGWKELQSGWGKRDVSDSAGPASRDWSDIQSSGANGKRAWNDIHSSGWGKRGWKEMQSTGWGKRSYPNHEDFNFPDSDWLPPVKPDADPNEYPTGWPEGKLSGPKNDWHIYEPVDEQALIEKLLESLQKSSWGSRNSDLQKLAEGEASMDEEHR